MSVSQIQPNFHPDMQLVLTENGSYKIFNNLSDSTYFWPIFQTVSPLGHFLAKKNT